MKGMYMHVSQRGKKCKQRFAFTLRAERLVYLKQRNAVLTCKSVDEILHVLYVKL